MPHANIERQPNELAPTSLALPERLAKNQAAIRLLNEWLADESGYDEKNWPVVKEALAANHTSDRAVFDE
jgi:hypothetical protein